jgi:opacity protein-like surface antigen
MPSPSRPSLNAVLSFVVVFALGAPAIAQVARPPAPPTSTSSSSDQDTETSTAHTVTAAAGKVIEGYNQRPLYSQDVAISAFAQISASTAANFLREDTTSSGGGLLSYRWIHRPWFGAELNYGLTRYTDTYFYGAIRVPHNAHEISLAYLLEGPEFKGFRPFLTLGGGAVVFQPVAPAPSAYHVDAKGLYFYGIGVQHPLFSPRWGWRLQYRGLDYGVPAFAQTNLDTHRSRHTSEPTFGIYYRF